jgi:hypothetical protein
MVVKGPHRKYLGSIETEELAAHYYDKYCIIMWGIEVNNYSRSFLTSTKFVQAKTNFSYSQKETIDLLCRPDEDKDGHEHGVSKHQYFVHSEP